MKKVGIATIAICLLAGCKDIPYQEKEPMLNLDENKINNILSSNYVEEPSLPIEVVKPEVPIIDKEPSREKGRSNKGRQPVDVVKDELPEPRILIDSIAPKIIGANDGIAQPTYLQETKHYKQRFINDGNNSRYEIEPVGESAALDFTKSPTISRWLTHIDDEETAPSYLFKVDDASASIKYALSDSCTEFEKATKDADKNEDGIYTIGITQKNSDVDLAKSSSDKKYCLTIWAIDEAGNKSNHKIEFFWHITIPPIGMDVNSSRYKAHHRDDDISFAEQSPRELFKGRNPIVLKNDLVLGHVILANPFSSSLSAKLDLKNALSLKIKDRSYQIQPNFITIRYFSYDLAKNEVGAEKEVKDGYVIINSNETLAAKFFLGNVLPISNVKEPNKRFWQEFSLELDFPQSDNQNSIVAGLTLTVRDASTGSSKEFPVPWGNDHDVRRR